MNAGLKEKAFDKNLWLDCYSLHFGTPSDVYAMLGYIHKLWKPMPGRFKDYICQPQSQWLPIHPYDGLWAKGTNRVSDSDPKCTKAAEYGVAAHWAYRGHQRQRSVAKESAIRNELWFKWWDWAESAMLKNLCRFGQISWRNLCLYAWWLCACLRMRPIDFAMRFIPRSGKGTGARSISWISIDDN